MNRNEPGKPIIMARRHRSGRSLRDLRAEAELVEKMGPHEQNKRDSSPAAERRAKPVAAPRMRVVWAVCDIGGRTVATFPYPEKAAAEARAADLKAKGKGNHFVRSIKEPLD
ncbi:hypothetical protein BH23PLA1_BH23PLA1_16510 [soil metagenome]